MIKKKPQKKDEKELKSKSPVKVVGSKVKKAAVTKALIKKVGKSVKSSIKKIAVKKTAVQEKATPKGVTHTPIIEKVLKHKEIVKEKTILKEVTPKIEKPVVKEAKIVSGLPKKVPVQEKIIKPTQEKPKEEIEVAAQIKKPEIKPEVAEEVKPKIDLKPLELTLPITIKDLSVRIQQKPSAIIKYLIEKLRTFATINQSLSEDIVVKILEHFGFEYKKVKTDEELLLQSHDNAEEKESLKRPPVITLMGHVDHGKTSLLDAIRKSNVAEKEHGGITQHIGAYMVSTSRGKITFLDTPGHEAFTAMRARGANITDIVILVVAADDGVMPQTVEAMDHAKAAKVPIVVALNKIDKEGLDLDRVKKQLAKYDLSPEEWGGQTIVVGVSAKTGEGIDKLLEMILLEAEMQELKAVYDKPASGVVVEAKLSKGQGPVVTMLVQSGTLHIGDNVICGNHYGKIRAMVDDKGQRMEKITPAGAAEIVGLSGLPEAGEKFYVLNDEKMLKSIMDQRKAEERERRISSAPKHISLEELYSQIQKGEVKQLNLVIKADVQGSLEAIKESLAKIDTKEVKLEILHSGIGPINSSDVILAEASNAIIIGFHVDADAKGKELASSKKVEIRTYRIIYDLLNEIIAALEGLLAPRLKKVFLGQAIVKRVFNLTKSGLVAGCYVSKGKITRQATINVKRGENVIFEGSLSGIKRFKDDVKEVAEGFECGLSFSGFTDMKENDIIEAYIIEKIARKL